VSKTPIVLQPGSHVTIGDAKVARVHWHEAPASGGTATVRDMAGNVLASIFYAGRGKNLPEPQPISFNPPISAVGGVVGSAPGGWLTIYVQGASETGH
jgi:hypothetical protein